MQHVAVKFPQFLSLVRPQCYVASLPCQQSGALSSICSTTMQREKDRPRVKQDSLHNEYCSLFIRMTWQNVCGWKADACTEVMKSLCLVNYLHLCDKFTRNCTCFNVYHFEGLQRSPCKIFLRRKTLETVDSIFVSCVELH